MLRYLNGGESHGKGLIAILEGMPSGVPLTADDINRDLARRQKGYGRGGRMRIEQDRVEFLSGVRKGFTLGTPITLHVANRDWENWKEIMAPEPGPPVTEKVVTCPRPGHADLVGAIKYNHRDIRNVLEKASARETAIRVAVGGVAKRLLAEFGIQVYSYTLEIGGVRASLAGLTTEQAFRQAEESEVRCPDPESSTKMVERIREAKHKGDTLGGVFEVGVTKPPIGLGSYAQGGRRLTARLAKRPLKPPSSVPISARSLPLAWWGGRWWRSRCPPPWLRSLVGTPSWRCGGTSTPTKRTSGTSKRPSVPPRVIAQ